MVLKKLWTILLFSLFAITLHAWDCKEQMGLECSYKEGFLETGKNVYLWGDSVNLRSKPEKAASVIKVLPAGSVVTLIDIPKNEGGEELGETLGNLFEYWYKVKAGNLEGYIWGGLLSKHTIIEDIDGDGKKEIIMAGIIQTPGSKQEIEEKKLEIRIVRDNKIISKAVSPTLKYVFKNYSLALDQFIKDEKLLKDSKASIFTYSILCTLAAVTVKYSLYFSWKNKKISFSFMIDGEKNPGYEKNFTVEYPKDSSPKTEINITYQMNDLENNKSSSKKETYLYDPKTGRMNKK